MLFASACLFALGMASPIEVSIVDPNRRLAWTPEGKTLDYKASQPRDPFLLKFDEMGVQTHERLIVLRIPWTRDIVPTVVVQYPSGGRREAVTIALGEKPKDGWMVPITVPRSATENIEGSFEFGVANGPWRTTGTQWPKKKQGRGEAFNVRFGRPSKEWLRHADGKGHWTLTSTLSRTPRHLAWRLIPYGTGGNPMSSSGSSRLKGEATWTYHFRADDPKSQVTRIDLQRRPLEWTKFGTFLLDPIAK